VVRFNLGGRNRLGGVQYQHQPHDATEDSSLKKEKRGSDQGAQGYGRALRRAWLKGLEAIALSSW
jgi:hypothetical protein